MTVDSDITVLEKFPIFQSFNSEQLRLLAFSVEHLTFEKDDLLFSQDEVIDGALIMIEGAVELTRLSITKDNIVVGTVGIDEIINETALIVPKLTHNNSARATKNTHVLRLSHAAFRRFLKEFPELVPMIHDYFDEKIQRIDMGLKHLFPNL